jgi:hypothetical protein
MAYADAEALSPARIDAHAILDDIRTKDDTALTAGTFLLHLRFLFLHS